MVKNNMDKPSYYKIKSITGDPNEDISQYLNQPCPECGTNLLTEQDYLQSLKVLKVINWLNKWFSWTMIFIPKKTKTKSVYLHCHDGVTIYK
jgi:hypothetical protein